MMETRQGERQWEVEADKADVLDDRGVAVLGKVVRPVRIVIYHGDETLVALAEKVIVDLKTKDLQLIGQVQAESNKGTRIFTEVLHWSATRRELTTDDPVVVEKEGFHIRGKGMVADTSLERMTFRERIASEVKLSPVKRR
jgi:LPS export ABC transporter protein LptC